MSFSKLNGWTFTATSRNAGFRRRNVCLLRGGDELDVARLLRAFGIHFRFCAFGGAHDAQDVGVRKAADQKLVALAMDAHRLELSRPERLPEDLCQARCIRYLGRELVVTVTAAIQQLPAIVQ